VLIQRYKNTEQFSDSKLQEKMKRKIILASRKSTLALAQTKQVINLLQKKLPNTQFEVLKIVTSGDKKKIWQQTQGKGSKGIFTKELEIALSRGEADLAIHSAKDLPVDMSSDLAIAGYLPREDARDVIAVRHDCSNPSMIATGSQRRRAQAKYLYPKAIWCDIRGNVETRLKKVVSGQADGTILALAGIKRLQLESMEELKFKPLTLKEIVPAVGQGAIALQCKIDEVGYFSCFLDQPTAYALKIERRLLHLLNEECQSAFGAHYQNQELFIFHEKCGYKNFSLAGFNSEQALGKRLEEIVREIQTS
jgi:hydroxymethylbilane synthase